jgi:PTH1 family peptidyl-tRNA hydrolase
VRALAAGAAFKRAPRRIHAELASLPVANRPALLALPLTSMNESGLAVGQLVRYFDVAPEDIVLVHDDIDLPFGKLRFHFARGAGGHNGVSSVLGTLGTREIWRLKIGVGRPRGSRDAADHVLHPFAKSERDDVDSMVVEGAGVIEVFAHDGGEAATQAAGDATARLGIAGGEPG